MEVVPVYLGSRHLCVFTSLRCGFSCLVTSELKAFQRGDGWCCGGRRGCCSSTSSPSWSHRSARVYQAKAAWSLNAHAANLFNYSPSSAACLMRGLSTDNAGNWTMGFTHSIIDHWFKAWRVILSSSCRAQHSKICYMLYYSSPVIGGGGWFKWFQFIFGWSVTTSFFPLVILVINAQLLIF